MAMRALGAQFNPDVIQKTLGFYAPRVERPDEMRVVRDLSYGPDARHRLDLFRPQGQAGNRPVLVFVHGGGFVGGDKGAPEAAFYNNVGAWAAAQGFVGVNVTYRLAPAHPWPAGAQDLAQAVEWLKANIGQHGGDPAQIVLVGQSAGGSHVAGYLAGHHGGTADVAGAVMMSAMYDVVNLEHAEMENAYYGTDPSRFAAQSSLKGLIASAIPQLFTVCELEPAKFQMQAKRLVDDWTAAKGALPPLIQLLDHNHLSIIAQVGTPHDTFGPELAAFVRKAAGR
jgi:acetyl esterase/lipase